MAHNEKNDDQVVVFVCEHGSAKSVIAAAYFDKLARERGLTLRAVARGTQPDEQIAPAASRGLESDGLSATEKPMRLSKSDVAKATRIVAFCELPADLATGRVEYWRAVPAVSQDYSAARDVILDRLGPLLDKLESGG